MEKLLYWRIMVNRWIEERKGSNGKVINEFERFFKGGKIRVVGWSKKSWRRKNMIVDFFSSLKFDRKKKKKRNYFSFDETMNTSIAILEQKNYS